MAAARNKSACRRRSAGEASHRRLKSQNSDTTQVDAQQIRYVFSTPLSKELLCWLVVRLTSNITRVITCIVQRHKGNTLVAQRGVRRTFLCRRVLVVCCVTIIDICDSPTHQFRKGRREMSLLRGVCVDLRLYTRHTCIPVSQNKTTSQTFMES